MNSKRIIRLSPLISNQIAAGEVVERPASVVKELIENSIDAKATKIEIETEGGGVHLIRVRDNGHGIEKDDLELAFCRHATSKIVSTEDLESIMSLGFRGEALASIVSVAKCRLTSKSYTAPDAWQINVHPDLSATITLASHAVGTTIEVADLFYNTPVRRKFLRSEKSEHLAIEEGIKRLALSHPEITFIYKHNQKLIRQYIGANHSVSMEERVAKICGQAFMEHAISLELTSETLKLQGWIASPALAKRQADGQFFFVNGRMVKDRLLNHAIKSLYQQHPDYIEGTYPAYVLFLTLSPSDVDVNVHPTKQEVRFSRSTQIHDFIRKGVQQAWCETPVKALNIESPRAAPSLVSSQVVSKPEAPVIARKRYFVFETASGIHIIDLKRDKQRLFEYYCEHNKDMIPMRPLLFPLRIQLQVAQAIIQIFTQALNQYGFECVNEENIITVYQQPMFLASALTESQFLGLYQTISESPNHSQFLNMLCSLFSETELYALNGSNFDLTQFPSLRLSHEDIERAFEGVATQN